VGMQKVTRSGFFHQEAGTGDCPRRCIPGLKRGRRIPPLGKDDPSGFALHQDLAGELGNGERHLN